MPTQKKNTGLYTVTFNIRKIRNVIIGITYNVPTLYVPAIEKIQISNGYIQKIKIDSLNVMSPFLKK